jgi:hypothetical protein
VARVDDDHLARPSQVVFEDPDDRRLFEEECHRARAFLTSFAWCRSLVDDLPPAYIVTDDAPDPCSALERYIEEMEMWVRAVERGDPIDEI